MKKRVLAFCLALMLCLTFIPVIAAETDEQIKIQVPGCGATFTVKNANTEYGLLEGDVPEYIITFPGENGIVSSDTSAVVNLYGWFVGDDPNDSYSGGGTPTMEAGGSYGYNFPGKSGKGVTFVTVFAMEDGSLALVEEPMKEEEKPVAIITFIIGYPVSGVGEEPLPANLIGKNAELHPLSDLIVEVDLPGETPFTDVFEGTWYHDAVKYVYENDIMMGVTETIFSPDGKLSRAMMVTMLHRLAGLPEAEGHAFEDVIEGAYYENAVAWAAENDIVSGYSATTFAPDDNITREQMALMMFNYADAMEIELPQTREAAEFGDADEISEWAEEAVEAMYRAEILNGKDGGNFDPKGTATRAEVAQMFMGFMSEI